MNEPEIITIDLETEDGEEQAERMVAINDAIQSVPGVEILGVDG